jgi:BASS family bile acid:Na+ symporter
MNIGLPITLFLIMTGVGMSLKLADFIRVFERPIGFSIGIVCQMFILPLVALVVIYLTELSLELATGLFVLALCPGGTTSNLYSYLARGDVGLSVSLTAVTGFITPFSIPFFTNWFIHFYGEQEADFHLPLISTWIKLVVITVLPITLGMIIRAQWPLFTARIKNYVSILSVLVLAFLIVSICQQLGSQLIQFAILTGPAAFILNITTMVLGYGISRYFLSDPKQTRTITLEVGLQNGTLALLVTSTILNSTTMSIAPSIYSLMMFFTAGGFTYLLIRKDTKSK